VFGLKKEVSDFGTGEILPLYVNHFASSAHCIKKVHACIFSTPSLSIVPSMPCGPMLHLDSFEPNQHVAALLL
jgi:hypothetical protein